MNTASIQQEHITVTPICNWNESMFITTKQLVADMSLVLFSWIWNRAPWTQFEQDHLDIVTTQATDIDENNNDNIGNDGGDGLIASNGSIGSELEEMFGKLWYITLAVIALMFAFCCCVIGYCLARKLQNPDKKDKQVVIEGTGTNSEGLEMQRPSTLEPSTLPNGQMYLQVGAQSPVSVNSASDGFPFHGVSHSDLANLVHMPFTVPPAIAQVSTLQTPTEPNTNDDDVYEEAATPVAMKSVCEACNKEAEGKLDDSDDCFYCFGCWKKWGDNDGGDNDDLYKRATSITVGNNDDS